MSDAGTNKSHFHYNCIVDYYCIRFSVNKQNSLKWFLKTALAYLGTPYRWGGDDPSGFDCSGFVLECLKTVGLSREHADFTADSLMRYFLDAKELEKPEKGALLFYLNEKQRAYHVVICLDDMYQIGASGGNSQTTDLNKAWNQNAYIKIRPIGSHFEKKKIIQIF